ncbi:DUF4350 domain-containing protein [Geopsychrobacter electrodiphilus]|uniref:DUF4350 domain-containing protein n=1 Tax=Geopsychrobacter electrodiphilus TaxID=225196 RepID=UPI0003A01FEF|nr:DUF4350 domain-containing protein [Geopsychrobacter electrodiphilus]
MRELFYILMVLFLCTPAFANQPRVLFDQGHGQVFVIEQETGLHLSRLARTFIGEGFEVSSTAHPLTAGLLDKTDALVISGAFRPFSPAEIAEIIRFIKRGGRLAVMIHIGPPLKTLLRNLGVDVANGVIREEEQAIDHEPLNFRTSRLAPHPLTRGIKDFALYGCWPLRTLSPAGKTLAFSSNRSWVDLSGDKRLTPGDAVQAFGVVVTSRIGQGELLVFGDDALFQNRFLSGNNLILAKNLGRWLAGALKVPAQEI